MKNAFQLQSRAENENGVIIMGKIIENHIENNLPEFNELY
jgi:translation initiation factor 2 beta subunit (eIF-2beta)/eIF-5